MQTLKRKQSKTKLTKEEMLARFEEEKRWFLVRIVAHFPGVIGIITTGTIDAMNGKSRLRVLDGQTSDLGGAE